MDFKFFVKSSFDVSLHFELFCKRTVHVQLFQIFYHTDFFSLIYFFVVLQKLSNYLFISSWVPDISKAAQSLLMIRKIGPQTSIRRSIFQNLFQNLQLLLFKILPILFFLSRIKFNSSLDSRHNVIHISQERQGQLILQQQETIHVEVELLMLRLEAIFQTSQKQCHELHHFRMLVAVNSNVTFVGFLFVLNISLLPFFQDKLERQQIEAGLYLMQGNYILTVNTYFNMLRLNSHINQYSDMWKQYRECIAIICDDFLPRKKKFDLK